MIFDDRYEVFLADTRESKTLHYQLRYQVYCEETGWERSRQFFHEKIERDSFDDSSHHFLVWDHASQAWVGGLRLVELPFSSLPISKFCLFDEKESHLFGQGRCVEISRLFVLPDFRCGRMPSSEIVVGDMVGRRNTGKSGHHYEVMLGLIRAAREFGLRKDISSWYFLVEPALARGLKRVGIDLQCCGPEVQHRGFRHPYCGEVATCFDRVFSGPDKIQAMFSKQNTYQHCSGLEPGGVRSVDTESQITHEEACPA